MINMNVEELTINIKQAIFSKLDALSDQYPVIAFGKPLIKRAITSKIDKLDSFLALFSDKEGNIDIKSILTEMEDSLINTKPFNVNIPIIGETKIEDGTIKFNIPYVDKLLVFNQQDIMDFKNAIINK